MAAKKVRFVGKDITYEDDSVETPTEAGQAETPPADGAADHAPAEHDGGGVPAADAGDEAPAPVVDASQTGLGDLVNLMRAGHRIARRAWLGEDMPERWLSMTRVAGVWVHALPEGSPWPTAEDLAATDWKVVG